jgi:hypothetical protein
MVGSSGLAPRGQTKTRNLGGYYQLRIQDATYNLTTDTCVSTYGDRFACSKARSHPASIVESSFCDTLSVAAPNSSQRLPIQSVSLLALTASPNVKAEPVQ